MLNMLESVFKNLGLTQKETKVLLVLVESGAYTASGIAQLIGMPRNTVRSMLDVLVKKGLVVKSRRANTQYYSVEKKENIIRQLKLKKVKMEEEISNQIELLNKYGDELSAHQYAKSRPKITFYEGIAGLEKVYEDTLTAKNGLRSWASCDDLVNAMPEYFTTYFKRRAANGITMRSIHPDTPVARDIASRDTQEKRDSRLVPADKYYWVPEIQVYNNKVNIASWNEKLGIIIESEEIAEAMGVFFEMCFEYASELKDLKNRDTTR